MGIYHEIILMIKRAKYISFPISTESNLYTDLGFDSLAFISFLVQIEETYSITFDISEMELCLQVGQLIKITKSKIKEREHHDQIVTD